MRENRITPSQGQNRSVYLEERRLGPLYWPPGAWEKTSKTEDKASVVKTLQAKGPPPRDKSAEVAAIMVDALMTMVEHYRQLHETKAT